MKSNTPFSIATYVLLENTKTGETIAKRYFENVVDADYAIKEVEGDYGSIYQFKVLQARVEQGVVTSIELMRTVSGKKKSEQKPYASFSELEESRNKYNERNDCTVKALATATGYSYEKCHNFLRQEGRQPKKGFHCEPAYKKIMNVGPNVHKAYMGKTIKSLKSWYLDKNKVYIIYTTRHVLCYRDGKAQDWTDGRQCRIQSIHEVNLKDAGERILESMSDTVEVLKTRKKRVAKVRYELRALWTDEHGDIIDIEEFRTYKRIPRKVISNIRFRPQTMSIIGRPDTKGKLAIYDFENEQYVVDSLPNTYYNTEYDR